MSIQTASPRPGSSKSPSRRLGIHNLLRGLGGLALLVAALVSITFLSSPAEAVDGFNNSKPLNYGLHWFRVVPGQTPIFDCGNRDDHECRDAVTISDFQWVEDTSLTRNGPDPYYDPNKPTIIYFHGWQPNSGTDREHFWWDRPGVPSFDTLKEWRDAGWNVGLFYWNQFANTPLPFVSHAEGKMWSSTSSYGMQYRYKDGSKIKLNKKPSSEDLGLPALSSRHRPVKWDNKSKISQAVSAVKFINGLNPAAYTTNVQSILLDLESMTCAEMVEEQACSQASSSPLCTGNRLDWREAFMTKVCQVPSVGDLAIENLNVALKDQVNPNVIFSGHSLGHQLATRTTTQMWMAYSHFQSQGSPIDAATNNYNALPKRLELFDPYATWDTKSYLPEYTFDGNDLDTQKKRRKSRTPYMHVFNYVKRLKEMTAAASPSFAIPVSYYHSSTLGNNPAGATNVKLRGETAYQRNRFDYYWPWQAADKHAGSREFYFASRGQGAAYPPLSNTVGQLSSQQGLASEATAAHVLQAMYTNNNPGVCFRQTSGMKDTNLQNAVFTASTDLDYCDEWFGGAPGDLEALETAVEQRLFNNTLRITADNRIDAVYVNGEDITSRLSSAGDWTTADVINNLDLHNGYNVIAVKASDLGGIAGLLAELDVDGEHYISGTSWKVTSSTPAADWMETDFDDGDWELATVHASYGDSPWFTNVSGFENEIPAAWIWSSDANNHDTVYFRYSPPVHGPWKVRTADSASAVTNLATAESVIHAAETADLADGFDDGSATANVLNFSDSTAVGRYLADDPFPNQPTNGETFALRATGTVVIETADTYTFGFNVDDGARLTVTKDGVETVVASLDGVQGPTDRLGQIYLDEGEYEIEVLAYENTGGSGLEVFVARGSHTSWNANDFKLLLPHDDLDRIHETEEDTTAICYDDSVGLDVGTTGTIVTESYIEITLDGDATLFLPQMQTYNGIDTAVVKSINTSTSALIEIEEEQSLDAETAHAAENVGWVAIDSYERSIRDAANNLVGYVPFLEEDLTDAWTTIQMPHTFADPVVIAHTDRTFFEFDPAHIRIRNVTDNTFEARVEEWAYQDGTRTDVEISFMVIESGIHYMRDGQIIQVGKQSVTQSVKDVFTQVSFPIAFTQTPVVLSHSQTFGGADPMTTRQRNVSNTGFQVLVEEEEAKDSTHATETIGWVAITGNSDEEWANNCGNDQGQIWSELSGTGGSEQHFTHTVHSGNKLTVTTTGSNGDADLYVRLGAPPTTLTYDCRGFTGTSNESCVIDPSIAGTYYIMVRAYGSSSFSNLTLQTTVN